MKKPGTIRIGSRSEGLPRAFVIGPTLQASQVSTGDHISNYGVAFHAGAGSLFLQVPANELRDSATDLSALGNRALARLVERVCGARFQTAVREIEAFLLTRLRTTSDPFLGRLLTERLENDPLQSVSTFAETTGYSQRQLRRLFDTKVGTSPKTVGRILRLRNAIDQLWRHKRSMSQIALASGYFDHAHMDNEFKAMMGCTPREYQSYTINTATEFNRYSLEH